MNDLILDWHGLPISLRMEHADLRAYVRAHFEAVEGDGSKATVAIRGDWRWGSAPDGAMASAGSVAAVRAGRGMMLQREGADGLRCTWTRVPGFPELSLSFLMSGSPERLVVDATCTYEPRGLWRRMRYMNAARRDKKRSRLFFKLMYAMVYSPVAWWLERTRGWGLIHASAVALPSGQAVLLAGQGGVGKSTLAMTLLSMPGARLISDNLVFHDQEKIHACPEPVRLDRSALSGIAAAGVAPERSSLPREAHPKETWRVDASQRALSAPVSALFVLRASDRPGFEPFDVAAGAQMLRAGNDLAREIEDHRIVGALLTMMAAERGRPAAAPAARLETLLSGARCGIFTVGARESIAQTAARLSELTRPGAPLTQTGVPR